MILSSNSLDVFNIVKKVFLNFFNLVHFFMLNKPTITKANGMKPNMDSLPKNKKTKLENSQNARSKNFKGNLAKGKKRNGKSSGKLSLAQLLLRLKRIKSSSMNTQKSGTWQSQKGFGFNYSQKKSLKPIIPPKSLIIILKEKPEKAVYNRRIIDYKHCGLLQRYIGLGGKILPRRQTRLTAKQQRYIARTIKSARILGLLPFVSKEKGFFR